MAAEAYRHQQAAYILRSIVVLIDDATTRAFLPVTIRVARGGNDTRAYISMRIIAQDAAYLAEVVADALRELKAWRRKYAQYCALSAQLQDIDTALQAALAQAE